MLIGRTASALVLSLAVSALTFAQELPREVGRGHTRVGCTTCHSAHKAEGPVSFALKPNTCNNPKTNEPIEGVSALCLACHAEQDQGGMGMVPVLLNHTHPFGVDANPKVANVPEEFLRDGKLECVGCHDPHASNQNYMLLRVDTEQGKKMDTFCALCHVSKAHPSDVKAINEVEIFNSMDETNPPTVRPVSTTPAPAPKPAAKPAPAATTE